MVESHRVEAGRRRIAVFLAATLACLLAVSFHAMPAGAWDLYVSNRSSGDISVIDSATGTVSGTIEGGIDPSDVIITPDSAKAFVVNNGADDISILDLTLSSLSSSLLDISDGPLRGAIAPDGETVYVVNVWSNDVSVMNAAAGTFIANIPVGQFPSDVVFDGDGARAYVTNRFNNSVSVIDTASMSVSGTIAVGLFPQGIALSPDGAYLYVTNSGDNTVSKVSLATGLSEQVIPVGQAPEGIAVSPDTDSVYVVNEFGGSVSVIDSNTDAVTETVSVGSGPTNLALTPDGTKLYVANRFDGTVSVVDTSTNTVTDTVGVGSEPYSVFVAPNRSPAAEFSASGSTAGAPVTLDASDSTDDDSIESYSWNFGDGSTATTTEPVTEHTYGADGTYTVSLTATDSSNCSDSLFHGRSFYCYGDDSSTASKTLKLDSSQQGPAGDPGDPGRNVPEGGASRCQKLARSHRAVSRWQRYSNGVRARLKVRPGALRYARKSVRIALQVKYGTESWSKRLRAVSYLVDSQRLTTRPIGNRRRPYLYRVRADGLSPGRHTIEAQFALADGSEKSIKLKLPSCF